MRFTYRRILESLPVKKNSNSSWWVRLWVRKASFFFTYLFINIGFSANAVSILSILVSLVACTLFMVPSKWAVVAAVVLINFWLVLDCVDGNIARCRKVKTVYGEFVDDVGGYFTVAFVYLAIGVCAYNFGGVLFQPNNVWLIILGGMSSVCDILARLIHKDYELFTDKTLTEAERQEKNSRESYVILDKKSLKYVQRRVGKEFGISGCFMLLTITSVIFNAYDLMTLLYFMFNGATLLITSFFFVTKAVRYDLSLKRGYK